MINPVFGRQASAVGNGVDRAMQCDKLSNGGECCMGVVVHRVVSSPGRATDTALIQAMSTPLAPQHFLYFFPLPQGQGSLRLTFSD